MPLKIVKSWVLPVYHLLTHKMRLSSVLISNHFTVWTFFTPVVLFLYFLINSTFNRYFGYVNHQVRYRRKALVKISLVLK